MVERLLLFFTKKGDCVLDPFMGVGSTLKACALTGRLGVGVELASKWVELSQMRLAKEVGGGPDQQTVEGDAREILQKYEDETFAFIVTSPPYWNILNKPPDHRVREERLKNDLATRYSDDSRDLANIRDYGEFLAELQRVFRECYRILKRGRYMAVVVTDFRHKSRYVTYHADVVRITEQLGFSTKGIIIYVKNAKKLYPYGYPFAFVPNVHHEYVLIFQKDRVNGADE